jgi:dihydrofolate synthase/folylpolyglutamate synthase
LTSSQADWVESLDPWPEEFGLDRMRALLAELGDPQGAYPSIHVVGTNGKSTATRTIAALLETEGLRAGAYTSPHVRSWAERIVVDGEEVDFERAVARVRGAAERLGATQFEVLTAAAFTVFGDAGVDVAVVEAGLGGRLDATNVVDARVVLLTNVALEHTEVLGDTLEQIAKEKLAVAHAARVVVLPDNTFSQLVDAPRTVFGGAKEATEAFLGHSVGSDVQVSLPGRLELRGDAPFELWDGAHNPAGAAYLVQRLERRDFVICASILSDKDAGAMLASFATVGDRFVATASANKRALPAPELERLARSHFRDVWTIEDPAEALAAARGLAGSDGAVLVTGSLYLLADLSKRELSSLAGGASRPAKPGSGPA